MGDDNRSPGGILIPMPQLARSANGSERRKTVRVDITPLRASLRVDIEGRSITDTALIVNLSSTGALLETMRLWPIGTQVLCTFTLTDAGIFSLHSTVVRRLESKSARPGRMGLHFVARPGTDSRIMGWVFRELARQRRSTPDKTR